MILLGGVVFFMYGMTMASEYLQKIAANRVRQLMTRLADRPMEAVLVGIFLTILLQSSGAVTSLLVDLGSAGVVNLSQVMGVIIGTAVGSTFTVQIISLNFTKFGIPLFIAGYLVFFITKRRVIKNTAGVFMGFGLIFFGLEMMGIAMNEFKNNQLFLDTLTYLKNSPVAAIFLTAFVTGVAHSSAVIIGFAMTLGDGGLLNLHDAMFWIYGANIGTTTTALIAAIGANNVGRQVAWSHFFYKVGSVLLFLFFTDAFATWVQAWEPGIGRDIANAHTAFNIIAGIAFLPFIKIASKYIEKLFPPTKSEREFGPKFIQRNAGVASTVAYAQALRETLRMSDIVVSMVKDSIKLLETDNPDLVDDVHARDNKVDILFREIKSFLVKYSDDSGHFNQQTIELLSFVTDLESAADIVDKNIVELSAKKNELKLEFSHQGWLELSGLHAVVCETLILSMSCLQLQDKSLATQVIGKKRELRAKERIMRESHLERLNQGLRESINTSSIHLELLSNYRRIASLFANQAYSVLADNKVEPDAQNQ